MCHFEGFPGGVAPDGPLSGNVLDLIVRVDLAQIVLGCTNPVS